MKRVKKWLSMILILGILFSNISTSMAYAEEVTEDVTNEEPGDIDLNDIPALFHWMDEMLPETIEEFDEKSEEWWNSLLTNQRLIAEGEYAFRRTFGNDGHADPEDESLDGYIARLEAGEDADALFAGTIYEGLDLETLKELKAEGLTMEDLFAMRESISTYAGDKAYLTTQWENFGGGRINRKFLDGKDAFCFNEEKKFPDGASYSMVTADQAGFTGRAAYIVEFYGESGETNSHWWNECQVAIWAVQAGCDTYDQGAAYAAAYCKERKITDSWYVSDYMDIVGKLVEQSRGRSGSCYVYKADDPANQDIAVYAPIWPAYEPEEEKPEYDSVSATAEKSASVTHSISIDNKYASVVGESLAGVVFEVYEDNAIKGTITTDANGKGSLSWQVSAVKSSTKSERYCSNYNDLSDKEKAKVTGYKNRDDAYNAALSAAQAEASALANAEMGKNRTVKIVEKEAPFGYTLTSSSTQTVTLNGTTTSTSVFVANNPWKAKLLIDKVDGETGERIPDDTEFKLYEWDGDSYEVSENYEIIRLEDGTYTVATKYEDGEQGYLYYTQTNEGKFGLVESKAPESYVLDPEVFYFRIASEGEVFYGHNVTPENYEIYDDTKFANRKTRHIFTKSDFTSQALLSEAVLEVHEILGPNEDGSFITEMVESWISDKDEVHYFYESSDGVLIELANKEDLPEGTELIEKHGHLIKGLKVGVSYLFREITAPYGYVGYDWMDEEVREENREENLAVEEIRFTVRDSHLIAEHQMMDQRAVGKLTVTKEGEFVVDAEMTITDEAKDYFFTAFSYVLGRVKNAAFEVYVKETIFTPDQTETIATYDGVRLVKDALVATILTDETGVAVLDKLPLGTYYVVEVGAGDGDFLLSKTVTDVALEYEGQEVAVVINDSTKYENARQKVKLTVTKKSRFEDEYKHLNTGEKVPEEEKDIALPGAVFGLFNAEDIVGFEINAGTGVVVERAGALLAADTLIEKMVTGEDGSVTFVSDLPCGTYYIKELQAPDGYFLSEEVYEFDASYTGQAGEDTIVLAYDFYNKPVIVTFNKIDTGSGNSLASCDLQVVDEDGNVIDAWRTDGTLHYIKGLKLNKTYILQETDPEDGWCKADDIPFTVTQAKDSDGNILNEVELVIDKKHLIDGVITMKNDRVTITVVKYDEKGNMLPGCTLKLEYSDQGTLKTIRIWRTDGQPTFFDKMRPGTYRLTELVAPDGYSVAPPIQFEVGDTERNYGVIIKNSKVPFTGDNSPLALSALGVFAGLLGMAVVVRRRKEYR